MRTMLILIFLSSILTGCQLFREEIGLQPGDKGAACYGLEGRSVNPFVNADTYGKAVEIATGDDTPVTPEQVASIAIALGCAQVGT